MYEPEYLMKIYQGGCCHWPSSISIIPQKIRRPNSTIITVLLNFSFKITPSLKTWLKHVYLHRSIDFKFIFDGVHLGLSSSTNIPRIAHVVLRVVFLLFLLCFIAITSPSSSCSSYSLNGWSVGHFVFTTKTTRPRPQVFSVNSSLTCKRLHFWRHFLVQHKILPNLVISNLVMVNYACALSPQSELGKYFEWVINNVFLLYYYIIHRFPPIRWFDCTIKLFMVFHVHSHLR